MDDPRKVIDDFLVAYDPESKLGELTWDALDAFARGLSAKFCAQLGHKPVADQCGIPAHDYCTYCKDPTPEQAPRDGRQSNA